MILESGKIEGQIALSPMWRWGLSALLLISLAPAIHAEQQERETEIVIRASISRREIERILNADNLDTVALSSREIADVMGRIPQGRAPSDFWASYQEHLRAWEALAEDETDPRISPEELIAAERVVNRTFDQVERVARQHGAQIPATRARSRSTR